MTASQANQRVHTFLVLKEPGRADRVVVWDTQDISVGRASENDIAVDDSEVSRRHALFSREGGAYVVQNFSESNGTFVNGCPVETQRLESGDRIQVARLEFTFSQVARNPSSLGFKVEWASELKSFALPRVPAAAADATVLGLADALPGGDEHFEVRPANEFEYDLHGMERSKKPRNLDEEIGLTDLAHPEEAAGRSTVSLHLEIEGLTPEQQAAVCSWLGKVIEVSSLRVRIKGDPAPARR